MCDPNGREIRRRDCRSTPAERPLQRIGGYGAACAHSIIRKSAGCHVYGRSWFRPIVNQAKNCDYYRYAASTGHSVAWCVSLVAKKTDRVRCRAAIPKPLAEHKYYDRSAPGPGGSVREKSA